MTFIHVCQIKYNYAFNRLYLLNGACYDQNLHGTHIVSHCISVDLMTFDLISLLVNFSCELGPIITRYDFLWAIRVILSNVQTDLNLT